MQLEALMSSLGARLGIRSLDSTEQGYKFNQINTHLQSGLLDPKNLHSDWNAGIKTRLNAGPRPRAFNAGLRC